MLPSDCVLCPEQVLEEEEYDVWLKGQLLAESSIENREELLLESAQRLETNLTLLGRRATHCSLTHRPLMRSRLKSVGTSEPR